MNYKQLLRYLIAGAAGFFLNLAILYLLTDVFHFFYLWSSVIAFALSLIVSFLLQKFLTFQHEDSRNMHGQFFLFTITALANLVFNTILLYLLVEALHVFYLLSQAVSSTIIAVESFFIYRNVIFKRRDR